MLRFDEDTQLFGGNVGNLRGSAGLGGVSVTLNNIISLPAVGAARNMLIPPSRDFPGIPGPRPQPDLELGIGLKSGSHFLFRLGLAELKDSLTTGMADNAEGQEDYDQVLPTIATVFTTVFENAFPSASEDALPLIQFEQGRGLVVTGLQGGQQILTNSKHLSTILSAGEITPEEGVVVVGPKDLPPIDEFHIYGSSNNNTNNNNNVRGAFPVPLTVAYKRLRSTKKMYAFTWDVSRRWSDEVILAPTPTVLSQLHHQIMQNEWDEGKEQVFIAVINGPLVGETPQEWTTILSRGSANFDYFRVDGGQRNGPDYAADFSLSLADRIIEYLPTTKFLQRFCAREQIKIQLSPKSEMYPRSRSRRPLTMSWMDDRWEWKRGGPHTDRTRSPLIRLALFFRPHTTPDKLFFLPPAFWEDNPRTNPKWVSAATLDSFRHSPRALPEPYIEDYLLLSDLSPFPYSPSRPAFTSPLSLVVVSSDSAVQGNVIDCGIERGADYFAENTQRSRVVVGLLRYDSLLGWTPDPEAQPSVHLPVFQQRLEIKPVDRDGRPVPFAHGSVITVLMR